MGKVTPNVTPNSFVFNTYKDPEGVFYSALKDRESLEDLGAAISRSTHTLTAPDSLDAEQKESKKLFLQNLVFSLTEQKDNVPTLLQNVKPSSIAQLVIWLVEQGEHKCLTRLSESKEMIKRLGMVSEETKQIATAVATAGTNTKKAGKLLLDKCAAPQK